MYLFLDYVFVVFHGSLILFNLTGWIWKKTRRLHLYTISLTLFSWFGLGAFYGWGYCPSTDWHWAVKRHLGEQDLPTSYIKYYTVHLTGIHWDPYLIEFLTVFLGISAFLIACWLNWRDWKKAR